LGAKRLGVLNTPFDITGAVDAAAQKVETGWLLAKATRSQPLIAKDELMTRIATESISLCAQMKS